MTITRDAFDAMEQTGCECADNQGEMITQGHRYCPFCRREFSRALVEKPWAAPSIPLDQRIDILNAHIAHDWSHAEIIKEAVVAAVADALADAGPKWVPVTERLPQIERRAFPDVLVYYDGVISVGLYNSNYDKWYDENGQELLDVTHWMPLPAPPKEATNATHSK